MISECKPNKYIDSTNHTGERQLVEAINPEYIEWIVDDLVSSNPEIDFDTIMKHLMKEYQGKANPKLLKQYIEDVV